MTTIYLDVDGVLNAFSGRPPKNNTQWHGEWSKATVEGFPILWSHELVEAFNSLAERDDVEIKWLTTWQESAATELAPVLGLNGGDWFYFTTEDLDDMVNWWKLVEIQKDIEETAPDKVVWIDDDINYDSATKVWLSTTRVPVLAICPNSNHGVSKKHMDAIIDFIG